MVRPITQLEDETLVGSRSQMYTATRNFSLDEPHNNRRFDWNGSNFRHRDNNNSAISVEGDHRGANVRSWNANGTAYGNWQLINK